MPAPGLTYFIKTIPMVKRLVEKELKQHHMALEHRKRRRNLTGPKTINESNSDNDDERKKEGKDYDDDSSDSDSESSDVIETKRRLEKQQEEAIAAQQVQLESILSQKMQEINTLERRQTVLRTEHESELSSYITSISKLRDNLHDCNYYYWDLWMTQWDQNIENDMLKNDVKQLKTKFNLNKKQLFQAKRQIDDLEE